MIFRRSVFVTAHRYGTSRLLLLLLLAGAILVPQAKAGLIPYQLSLFALVNTNADGTAVSPDGGKSVILTGGNNGTGLSGTTDLTTTATATGLIEFQYIYASLDDPMFDRGGFLVAGVFTPVADTDGQFGTTSFFVMTGDIFGFRVETDDNTQEPGVFTISEFNVNSTAAPEPATLPLVLLAAITMLIAFRRRRYLTRNQENRQ
jgi:hypothetical protein